MTESESRNESREDVLHVPNLFEYFCMRTSDDMRTRGGNDEPPAASFASLIVTILVAFAFYVFGKPELAKATFVLFGALLLWTVWGVVVRSSEQISQKADNIKAGVFPPASAPFVLARLKWWNHLVVPQRWGKHSRLFDRKTKLERKMEEIEKRIVEAIAKAGGGQPYTPPNEAEILELAGKIRKFSDRNDYEVDLAAIPDEIQRLRAELLLYQALLRKALDMTEKMEKIEKLSVVFHNVSPEDLSQAVSEAIQVLEERRILVLRVDNIDPGDFIDLVTVRVA